MNEFSFVELLYKEQFWRYTKYKKISFSIGARMLDYSIMLKYLLLTASFFISAPAFSQLTICHQFNKINPTQEPANGPSCRVVNDTFYFEGAVTEDLFYELRDYHPDIKHLELNSYGGLVEAAYKIAALVRERQITTNVRKDAKCASACTLIYQAGIKRTAHPSVRFLYHGARLSNLWVSDWVHDRLNVGREKSLKLLADQFDEVAFETKKFFGLMLSYGMDARFIDYYKNLPEAKDWFADGNFTRTENLIISSPKLIEYNIVQGFDFRNRFAE